MLLRVPLDKVEPRQVNARKRLVFNVPFLELPLREPQMKDLQAILHLENSYHKIKIKIRRRGKGSISSLTPVKRDDESTDHEENAKSESISPPIKAE